MYSESILINDGVYHVFTKSIAEYKVFNSREDFLRIQQIMKYYQMDKPRVSFSRVIKDQSMCNSEISSSQEKIVAIIVYCIMPTHVHFILRQLKENGISVFMNNMLNSYTKYFNIKHNRKGPLWESRFKRVLVMADEYLLHLTRYIHLNPVTAYLVNKPEHWEFSSYQEYIGLLNNYNRLCDYSDILEITPQFYKKFVEDRIDYQRRLSKIKSLVFDDIPNPTT